MCHLTDYFFLSHRKPVMSLLSSDSAIFSYFLANAARNKNSYIAFILKNFTGTFWKTNCKDFIHFAASSIELLKLAELALNFFFAFCHISCHISISLQLFLFIFCKISVTFLIMDQISKARQRNQINTNKYYFYINNKYPLIYFLNIMVNKVTVKFDGFELVYYDLRMLEFGIWLSFLKMTAKAYKEVP